MKRSILSVVLLTTLILASSVAGASSPNKVAPDLGENEISTITASIECQVVGVLAGNRVVLRDIASGAEKELTIAPSVKLRARSKRAFGKRKLSFSDLGVGQTVKLTVMRHNGAITRIDVLEKAANTG